SGAGETGGRLIVSRIETDAIYSDARSKRFPDTGGWGYAEFDYDVASDLSPSGTGPIAGTLPYDSDEKRLRVHGLPEAVKADAHPSARQNPSGPNQGDNMSTAVVQDVTAMQRGIDETHRRFEDAFNRGDAAGAARQLYTRNAC